MSTTSLVKNKKKHFVITGFGQFHGVTDNPTTTLVNHLSALPQYNNNNNDDDNDNDEFDFTILEVSVQACQNFISQLEERWKSKRQQIIIQNQTENEEEIYYFLHLGVDSRSEKIKLEQCAYNNMTFRVPDETSYQPDQQSILSSHSLEECCQTNYALTDIFEKLQTSNPLARDRVVLSTDPGRFLCNYIYYSTLNYSEMVSQQEKKKVLSKSLFVHVPPFEVIDFSVQLSILQSLIQVVQEMY
eukprot:scaffold2187_cov182-Ochromonas_danica.AAC.4